MSLLETSSIIREDAEIPVVDSVKTSKIRKVLSISAFCLTFLGVACGYLASSQVRANNEVDMDLAASMRGIPHNASDRLKLFKLLPTSFAALNVYEDSLLGWTRISKKKSKVSTKRILDALRKQRKILQTQLDAAYNETLDMVPDGRFIVASQVDSFKWPAVIKGAYDLYDRKNSKLAQEYWNIRNETLTYFGFDRATYVGLIRKYVATYGIPRPIIEFGKTHFTLSQEVVGANNLLEYNMVGEIVVTVPDEKGYTRRIKGITARRVEKSLKKWARGKRASIAREYRRRTTELHQLAEERSWTAKELEATIAQLHAERTAFLVALARELAWIRSFLSQIIYPFTAGQYGRFMRQFVSAYLTA